MVRSLVLILGMSVGTVAAATEPEEKPSPYGELGGGVALTNDRVWRGVSQTAGDPAIIGELKWTHYTGLLAGIWASNLSFEPEDDVHLELLPFVGHTTSVGKLNIEVAYLYHRRPSSQPGWDFGETLAALGCDLGIASARGGVFHSFDYSLGGSSTYVFIDVKVPVGSAGPLPFALIGHVGSYRFSDSALDDYDDWKAGFSVYLSRARDLSLSVAYSDTNLGAGEESLKGSGFADGRVAAVLTRSF